MRQQYETWFHEVSATRGYSPPSIAIGTAHENPLILTRQDWQMVGKDGWGDSDLGYWKVSVANAGAYEIRFRFGPFGQEGEAELGIQDIVQIQPFEKGATEVTFKSAQLVAGDTRLEARLKKGGQIIGVRYVDVTASKP